MPGLPYNVVHVDDVGQISSLAFVNNSVGSQVCPELAVERRQVLPRGTVQQWSVVFGELCKKSHHRETSTCKWNVSKSTEGLIITRMPIGYYVCLLLFIYYY